MIAKRQPHLTRLAAALGGFGFALSAHAFDFSAGDLVLSIYGGGGAGDNQASAISLQEVTTSGSFVGQMTLPQFNSGANWAISGEYGSSSEGSLSLSADGHSLAIMGYGVNAAAFNAATVNATNIYGTQALAQTTSLQGTQYTAVPRVVADIGANGKVDTSTALYNFANTNNPRSVATVNGSAFWVSGQGVKGDGTTQGVQYAVDGASQGTVVYAGTDTRTAEIVNNELYLSTDSKQTAATGTKNGTANIAVFGPTLPTGAATPSVLPGIDNSVTLSAGKGNGISASGSVNLSPENFYFANSSTLYVADGGQPKQGGLGDGGLQKWSLENGNWVLDYTLSAGLGLVSNKSKSGTTGLIGLTGEVVGGQVELFATNSTVGDLDPTYLYGISDSLSATSLPTSESFTVLEAAAAGTNIRGVAFAPTLAVPEPASWAMMLSGGGLMFGALRRRRNRA